MIYLTDDGSRAGHSCLESQLFLTKPWSTTLLLLQAFKL